MSDLKHQLERSLSKLEPKAETEWDATPAAVLIPLYQEHGDWNLLFTRRTDSVDVHAGQISFPGGQIEDADVSIVATALREAQEEIGLNPEDVETLGQLNPLYTVTQFLVTPVVGSNSVAISAPNQLDGGRPNLRGPHQMASRSRQSRGEGARASGSWAQHSSLLLQGI